MYKRQKFPTTLIEPQMLFCNATIFDKDVSYRSQ